MVFRPVTLALVAGGIALLGGVASAGTVQVGNIRADISIHESGKPAVQEDFDSTDVGFAVQAFFEQSDDCGAIDCAWLLAYQDIVGVSDAWVDANLVSASTDTPLVLLAKTRIILEIGNNTAAPKPVEMLVDLKNMSLFLDGDYGGAELGGDPFWDPTSESVGAYVRWGAWQDGDSIKDLHYKAYGGNHDYVKDPTNNLSGTMTDHYCDAFGCSGKDVAIDDVSFVLDLGVLAPGEKSEVILRSFAGIAAPTVENYASARIGDPNTVNFAVSFDRSVATVPLPGTAGLLVIALSGFGVLRRALSG